MVSDSRFHFNAVEWGVFGAMVGLVNFAMLYLLSFLWEIDIFIFAKAAATGKIPLGWISASLQNFFFFELIFWAITVLFGKFLLSWVKSGLSHEYWRLFAPVVVGRILIALVIYMNFDPMFYVIQVLLIGITVFFAASIFDLFNRRYPA